MNIYISILIISLIKILYIILKKVNEISYFAHTQPGGVYGFRNTYISKTKMPRLLGKEGRKEGNILHSMV